MDKMLKLLAHTTAFAHFAYRCETSKVAHSMAATVEKRCNCIAVVATYINNKNITDGYIIATYADVDGKRRFIGYLT